MSPCSGWRACFVPVSSRGFWAFGPTMLTSPRGGRLSCGSLRAGSACMPSSPRTRAPTASIRGTRPGRTCWTSARFGRRSRRLSRPVAALEIGRLNGSRGSWRGRRPSGFYNASKAAIINLTRQLAADYSRYGIRINGICPGWIPTGFNDPVSRSPHRRGSHQHGADKRAARAPRHIRRNRRRSRLPGLQRREAISPATHSSSTADSPPYGRQSPQNTSHRLSLSRANRAAAGWLELELPPLG